MILRSVDRKKAIIVVSEDWYFLSHRMGLAQHLLAGGWDVVVATQINRAEDADRIRGAGLRLVSLPLERGRLLSAGDLRYLLRLRSLYKAEKPDVVHHVAMKPVLYGSLAALGVKRAGVINALAGLGYLFTNARGPVRAVRGLVLQLFRRLFTRARTRVILQNAEDMALFRDQLRIPSANLRLVRGAGVEIAAFHPPVHGMRKTPVIVMVTRLLRDKGIYELVEAARLLQREGIAAHFQVVGGIDARNPNSLTLDEINALHAEGVVEWLGHRADINEIYRRSDIAVLPSYREGLPKSLLEAAASGLPIVTTDTSGCREIVTDGVNGFLVPVRSVVQLADALRRLVVAPDLRARMGAASRKRAESEFRHELILEQTAAVYAEVADV